MEDHKDVGGSIHGLNIPFLKIHLSRPPLPPPENSTRTRRVSLRSASDGGGSATVLRCWVPRWWARPRLFPEVQRCHGIKKRRSWTGMAMPGTRRPLLRKTVANISTGPVRTVTVDLASFPYLAAAREDIAALGEPGAQVRLGKPTLRVTSIARGRNRSRPGRCCHYVVSRCK
jgi:hypothetical protein